MTEILQAVHRGTNAEMIAKIGRSPVGYLKGSVLDVTYGKHGGFWKKWRPEDLTTSDLYHPADHAWDYLALPCADGSFDDVVFDADYKLNGTPAVGEMDERYGTGAPGVNRVQRLGQIERGAIECFRVCRRFTLVKCMDMVEGGHMRWQGDLVTRALEERGGEKVDEFYLVGGSRAQPKDRTKKCPKCRGEGALLDGTSCAACVGSGRVKSVQQHAHGKPSKLLVFAKPKGR